MGKNSLRKKIMLKGVTTTPDDYLCEDGELAGAMGVENTDGGMTGVSQHGPEKVMKMASGHRVVYEHKVEPSYNWIVWDESSKTVGYVKDNTEDGRCVDETGYKAIGELRSDTMPGVEAIGNTLMVRCSEDGKNVLHYVLWKPETNSYKYLGTHIPDIEMRFGIDNYGVIAWGTDAETDYHFVVEDLTGFSVQGDFRAIRYGDSKNGNSVKITSAVRAAINKTLSEAQTDGFFVQPFLVRYALKMYDGTHVMPSAPVYMQVTDLDEYGASPYCIIDNYTDEKVEFHVEYIRSKLAYIVKSEAINRLKGWEDIIKGVDVYVTTPIYTFREEEITTTIGSRKEGDTFGDIMKNHYCIGSRNRYYKSRSESVMPPFDDFGKYSAYDIIHHSSRPTTRSDFEGSFDHNRPSEEVLVITHAFNIGYKEKDDYYEEVRDAGRFYLLHSYSLEELKSDELTWVDVEKNIIKNISVTPMLDRDSYHDHDTILADTLYTYNKRLNLAGVSRDLYRGFKPSTMLPYITMTEDNKDQFEISVEIYTENQSAIVRSAVEELSKDQVFSYLFYSGTGGQELTIRRMSDGKTKKMKLDDHNNLNGSVFYDGVTRTADEFEETSSALPDEKGTLIRVYNKLHTSEAENPWIFNPTNINTIGEGKILGMGPVTTALSQGQHGSFPMYCFTTVGIWSLSVNETGGWRTSQTVTRDVMKEGTPILLIDDAIIFMSGQGMMMLQGDRTTNMTYDQKKRQTIRASRMAGLMRLIREKTLTDFTGLITDTMTDEQIADVLTSDMMSYMEGNATGLYYDYVNQRVMMGCYGEDTKPMSWVYYLDKRQWTVAPWKLMNRVNTYPECYAMLQEADGNNYMVRLDTMERSTASDGEDGGKEDDILLLTRPMKLGETADALKELENLKVEGLYDKDKLGMAVWGTRDYKHWHLVGSCKGLHLVRKHGSGYLAFVLAIVGKLGKDDYLDSLTVEYQLRYGQKLHGMGYKET